MGHLRILWENARGPPYREGARWGDTHQNQLGPWLDGMASRAGQIELRNGGGSDALTHGCLREPLCARCHNRPHSIPGDPQASIKYQLMTATRLLLASRNRICMTLHSREQDPNPRPTSKERRFF